MFALVALPVVAISIGALDYNRASAIRQHLQSALDSGLSFAAARVGDEAAMESAFLGAFKASLPQSLREAEPTFHFDSQERRLEASAGARVPVHMVGLFSGNVLAVSATAELRLPETRAVAEAARRKNAPEVSRQTDEAESRVREALGRLLPPSDAVATGGQIDPAEIERMAQEILRRLGQ